MGEYADMAIDEALAACEFQEEDVWAWGGASVSRPTRRHRRRKHKPLSVTCDHCGQKNLIWHKVDGFWRLAERFPNAEGVRVIHSCIEFHSRRWSTLPLTSPT